VVRLNLVVLFPQRHYGHNERNRSEKLSLVFSRNESISGVGCVSATGTRMLPSNAVKLICGQSLY
jgi:hypothetical protein